MKHAKHEVKVVVISACHSERLANIIYKYGFPVVIGITESQPVLEAAAYIFNDELLKQLLAGNTPKEAFNEGLTKLRASTSAYSCCCDHEHSSNCLWLRYKNKYGEEKAH